MNDSDKQLNDLLEKIDNIDLLSDEQLKDMDFYDLAYYMQTLNQLDELSKEETIEEGEE